MSQEYLLNLEINLDRCRSIILTIGFNQQVDIKLFGNEV